MYNVEVFRSGFDNPAEIARLHLEVRQHQEATDNNTFSDIYESQADLTAIGSFYIEPGGNFWVARKIDDGEIAGFVGIRNLGEGVGELKRMAVMVVHRRQRLGLLIAQTAVGWARAHDLKRLKLCTAFKEHARPIYERVGFVITGTKNEKDWMMENDLLSTANDL